jgi:hypothetical protein
MIDEPEFLAGLTEQMDNRPFLIVTKLDGVYTDRRFKKAIKKLCKHFSIPTNLTSLIGVSALHDYELAIFNQYVFLYRIDTTFAEIVVYEPAVLHATFEMEYDNRIIQFI